MKNLQLKPILLLFIIATTMYSCETSGTNEYWVENTTVHQVSIKSYRAGVIISHDFYFYSSNFSPAVHPLGSVLIGADISGTGPPIPFSPFSNLDSLIIVFNNSLQIKYLSCNFLATQGNTTEANNCGICEFKNPFSIDCFEMTSKIETKRNIDCKFVYKITENDYQQVVNAGGILVIP